MDAVQIREELSKWVAHRDEFQQWQSTPRNCAAEATPRQEEVCIPALPLQRHLHA